jgi:hypothetical protein
VRQGCTSTTSGTRATIWAQTAATTKDLMARMGHDMRAALIYQHATGKADRVIADRLSDMLDEHSGRHPHGEDGSAGALVPVR